MVIVKTVKYFEVQIFALKKQKVVKNNSIILCLEKFVDLLFLAAFWFLPEINKTGDFRFNYDNFFFVPNQFCNMKSFKEYLKTLT